MSIEYDHLIGDLTGRRSRRAVLHTGVALLAGLGASALPGMVGAQATPTAGALGDGFLLVQSFSQGSLFPTQGDVGAVPYTVILWDAADRGFFFVDRTGAGAGVAPTERVLDAIGGGSEPLPALLVATAADESGEATSGQQVWALGLVSGGLGADPGAVTYQGEPLTSEEAMAVHGGASPDLPEGTQELGAGYLILTGLAGFNPGADSVLLEMT